MDWLSLWIASIGEMMAQSGAGGAGSGGAGSGGGAGGSSGNNTANLVWAIVLLGLGLLLAFLEVFLPSGGLIALAAAGATITGIVLMFGVSTTAGLAATLAALLATIVVGLFALRVLPDTFLMRWITLRNDSDPDPDADTPDSLPPIKPNEREALTGMRGRSLTELRPVGTCLINGRREECLSAFGTIPAGREIEVVHAGGLEIKVREVTEPDADARSPGD